MEKGMGSIQQNSFSIQERQHYFQEKNKKKSQKLSETERITLSIPRPKLYSLQLKRQKIPSSLGPVWKYDSKTEKARVQELLGDECLDLFMPVKTKSPNKVSNNNSIQMKSTGAMPKLPSYLELIDRLKNNRDFCEFCRPTDELLINHENKEFFSKTYSITDIHPLLVDHFRTVLLFLIFLNDCDIMFL
ncbi:unnamed protein product [Rhizophagus irregularis]|uniref:Uncharacterized protein n=1 Tax=Rhizophagus irregularis TaxID=588596 RepID=A0A2N1NDF2_9GLOM|nr:hypothetical protein RhiirC2_777841 [Rhizophagus irregularis]CAB4384458.1 unnamed protein product [Rhizophagus irregularis]CAB5357753.1 unnamed protein product [Rhizophagus irregularis]